MSESSHGVKEKEWRVEYKKGFWWRHCRSCGLKTRERVHHFITDYFSKDGSPYTTHNFSPWHHNCHDEHCQHYFCVGRRGERHIDVFGAYIVMVIKAIGDMTTDIPGFLSNPHRELNGLSPIHIIWKFDKCGFQRVMNIIEGVASGTFV